MNAVASLLLVALPAFAPLAPPMARFTFTEPHMGTRFKIVLFAPDAATADRAARAAFDRIAALDAMLSDYRSDSELMRLCQRAGGGPAPVSSELFFVLSKAQEVSRLSGGAFDVTIGPVVRLWRRARRTGQAPDPKDLAAARALVGYRNMALDPSHQTVQLLKEGMRLDLGGIAKGYAADEALRSMARLGIASALVAAGGDIAVSSPPPDEPNWKIGIAPLLNPESKPTRYLLLHDAAVSTSGDAEQHFDADGRRYSHIVDPKTGVGLAGRRSVTVVARRGIEADSLTKVVSILGPDRAFPLIDKLDGVAALVVRQTPKGIDEAASHGFQRLRQIHETGQAAPPPGVKP